MKFKGTKGKWISEGKTIKRYDKQGNKKIISYAISKEFNSYYNTELEAEANAKLISKAPEILHFIKEYYKFLNITEQEKAIKLIKEATII